MARLEAEVAMAPDELFQLMTSMDGKVICRECLRACLADTTAAAAPGPKRC